MEYDKLKDLIDDMGNSKLSSLEIDFPDGMKIRMKKGKEENDKIIKEEVIGREITRKEDVQKVNRIVEKQDLKANDEEKEEYKYIKSPMVGTFYSKPSPNEDSFVEVGEKINKGHTTCIIEAMKLMNEIESEFDGEIVEIMKKDGEPVEFGEALIKLK